MNKLFFATSCLFALGFAVAGCAVETGAGEASDTSAEALRHKKPKVVHEGEHCGGFISNAPVCASGLKCVLGQIADAGGLCYAESARIAYEGEHCGGFINNAFVCAPGLTCHLKLMADLGGTCEQAPPVAQKGEHCGGNIKNAPVCADGLTCVLGPIPDVGGSCQ